MEKFEEKVIDLVDIISETDPDREREPTSTPVSTTMINSPMEKGTSELEALVRQEVERLIKSMIDDNIQKMIREIMVQEVEKAVAREIESLKRK
jgi:hypothetical protein